MIITWEVLYIFQLLLLAEKKGRIFKVIFFINKLRDQRLIFLI
jgi:hypothetical protein